MKDINKEVECQIIQFNKLFKEYDAIYQCLSDYLGLNKVQTGVIYTVQEFRWAGKKVCTQKDITDTMLYSKQSVNSAVKDLIKAGYLEFESIKGNRKSKNIVLTEKGLEYADQKIDKIVAAENRAFSKLDGRDRRELLFLFEKISELIMEEFAFLE